MVWAWVVWAVWDSNKVTIAVIINLLIKKPSRIIIGEGFILKMSIIFLLNLFLEQIYEDSKKNHSTYIFSKFYNS